MTRNRIIMAVAIVLTLACLSGAALLMPHINHMRRELQLVANDELMKNLPPRIAVTQAALGSFRGLAVDVLWGRVTHMKQEGKFYEAMELSKLITQLQPRFPQVWQFHAWNMAYNISVATYTPQERWIWVKEGINLLRDEGIPLNPSSVLLYRELGWIFLHKVGQLSDEAHWYYKQQLAQEWQDLLGPPPQGSTQEVIDWFRPIADAYAAYINVNTPAGQLKEELYRLSLDRELAGYLKSVPMLSVKQLEVRLPRIREQIADRDPELANRLDNAIAMVNRQLAAGRREPLQRLLAARPDIAPLLNRLAELGLEPNRDLLSRLNVAQTVRSSANVRVLGLIEKDPEAGEKLRAFMDDPAIAEQRRILLAFTRALVLQDQYNMDPLWMLELMEGDWYVKQADRAKMRAEGTLPAVPLDWRHPASHGLYWAALGVRRSHGLLRPGDFDVLNTDRQVIHALQQLKDSGRINYDPVMHQYSQLPDPRYVDAYHHAVYGSIDRVAGDALGTVAPESFEAGHENFLAQAVQDAWLYGDQQKANEYYATLRRLYTRRGENRAEIYSQPIDEFVMREFIKDEAVINLEDARAAILGLITQAIEQGLVNDRTEVADRYMALAQRLHRIYQEKQDYVGRLQNVQNRMALPSWDQMQADAFSEFMRRPVQVVEHLLIKSRAWRGAPEPWRQRVYDLVAPMLQDEATAFNLQLANVYPEPSGMEAYRKANPAPPALLARPNDPPLPPPVPGTPDQRAQETGPDGKKQPLVGRTIGK